MSVTYDSDGVSARVIVVAVGRGMDGRTITLTCNDDDAMRYVYELLLDGENLRSAEEGRKRKLATLQAMRTATLTGTSPTAPADDIISW